MSYIVRVNLFSFVSKVFVSLCLRGYLSLFSVTSVAKQNPCDLSAVVLCEGGIRHQLTYSSLHSKILIPKALHKFIRIYLYSIVVIVELKTKNVSRLLVCRLVRHSFNEYGSFSEG
jgi:hypothetical protein